MDDEENFKALGAGDDGSLDAHGNPHVIGSQEWRNYARRQAFPPKRNR